MTVDHTSHRAAGEPDLARPTSRRRWLLPAVLLLVWLAVAAVGGPFQGRLAEVQENDSAAFLPDGVESTDVSALASGFADDETFPAFVVLESADGSPLTPEQLGGVAAFAATLPELPVVVGTEDDDLADTTVGDLLLLPEVPAAAQAPGGGGIPVVPSEDGEAAFLVVPIDAAAAEETLADGETGVAAVVEALREADGEGLPEGVDSYVAGPAGATADFVEAFGEIDGILLGVALGAVLVILLLVYRSPALPFLVIFSAVFALAAASVVVYYLAAEDLIGLNGQSQGILFILVVGAATDYALLLVSRYREELRRHDDSFRAMAVAWRRAFEPIVASGTTVVLGLLCLLLSDLGSNRGLGPVASVGHRRGDAVGADVPARGAAAPRPGRRAARRSAWPAGCPRSARSCSAPRAPSCSVRPSWAPSSAAAHRARRPAAAPAHPSAPRGGAARGERALGVLAGRAARRQRRDRRRRACGRGSRAWSAAAPGRCG